MRDVLAQSALYFLFDMFFVFDKVRFISRSSVPLWSGTRATRHGPMRITLAANFVLYSCFCDGQAEKHTLPGLFEHSRSTQ